MRWSLLQGHTSIEPPPTHGKSTNAGYAAHADAIARQEAGCYTHLVDLCATMLHNEGGAARLIGAVWRAEVWQQHRAFTAASRPAGRNSSVRWGRPLKPFKPRPRFPPRRRRRR